MTVQELTKLSVEGIKKIIQDDKEQWLNVCRDVASDEEIGDLELVSVYDMVNDKTEEVEYSVYGLKDDKENLFIVFTLEKAFNGLESEFRRHAYWHKGRSGFNNAYGFLAAEIYSCK